MTNDQREIHRKKRVLEYAERIGNIKKACRYFGVARLDSARLSSHDRPIAGPKLGYARWPSGVTSRSFIPFK